MAKYSDINTEFLESNSELNITTIDKETIIKSLLRFLQTPKGSDPFNRDYGCSLYYLLFENGLNTADAQMFLYMDITEFEPRINISPAGINLVRIDENTFELRCEFTIPAINNEPLTIDTNIKKE